MTERASLLLPDIALSECLFGAIVRDTRGARLSDKERINYFPASPLIVLTLILEGETRMSSEGDARSEPTLDVLTVTGPRTTPFMSWNPGPVFAVSIGFYPDAWLRLTGIEPSTLVDRTSSDIPLSISELLNRTVWDSTEVFWRRFQDGLQDTWSDVRGAGERRSYKSRLSDWGRALIVRGLMSETGKTVRALQRRVKHWSGQSRRSLDFFAQIETVHELATQYGTENPAELAVEAGFSDQSHMGRMVRKATGFAPVQLNRLVKTHEAFWCYRLLGERF